MSIFKTPACIFKDKIFLCHEDGVSVHPASCLNAGLLTGNKFTSSQMDQSFWKSYMVLEQMAEMVAKFYVAPHAAHTSPLW